MTRETFNQKINQIINEAPPFVHYATMLRDKLSKDDDSVVSRTLQYADQLLSGAPEDLGMNCRTLLCIAEAAEHGKSDNFLDTLAQHDVADASMIWAAEQLIDEQMPGAKGGGYVQTANIDLDELPVQGWKIHIATENMDEYLYLCSLAIPEFVKQGVQFKIVELQNYEAMAQSSQVGKSFTIYLNSKMDFEKLSPRLQQVLMSNKIGLYGNELSHKPLSDLELQNTRIFMRYGCVKATNKEVTTPDGHIIPDPKFTGNTHPDFANPMDVFRFYANIQDKYNQTGDRKAYTQEYYTMAECQGSGRAYICFKIADEHAQAFKNATYTQDPHKLSFVGNDPITGEKLLFIHQSAISRLQDIQNQAYAQGQAMLGPRPDWDYAHFVYKFPAFQINDARTISQAVRAEYGPEYIHIAQNTDGECFIVCDAALKSVIDDKCAKISLVHEECQSAGNVIFGVNTQGYAAPIDYTDYLTTQEQTTEAALPDTGALDDADLEQGD